MEEWIIEQWDKNKSHLKEYFKIHKQSEYPEYSDIVKILIKEVLNRDLDFYYIKISEEFDCLDHGNYQGTQIFILHEDIYQPSINEYYIFDNYYGSCSGCDTLLRIQCINDSSDFPNEEQIKEYMTLCLHIVQRIKCLSKLYE